MRILVTNDDGIDSEGLLALKSSLSKLGEVVVIAPDRNWSASGHAKSLFRPLRVTKKMLPDGSTGYACNGTPSDCVALAMLEFAGPRPEIVVSGINKGANLGDDITYSGTVAAAMESAIHNVPSIAVSLTARYEWNFEAAADFAAILAPRLVGNGLEPDVLLNVNVPNIPKGEIKGVMIARLGKRVYQDKLVRKMRAGREYFWIGGDEPGGNAEEGTDIWAVANSYISVTPIHLDLTNYPLIDKLSSWNLSLKGGEG